MTTDRTWQNWNAVKKSIHGKFLLFNKLLPFCIIQRLLLLLHTIDPNQLTLNLTSKDNFGRHSKRALSICLHKVRKLLFKMWKNNDNPMRKMLLSKNIVLFFYIRFYGTSSRSILFKRLQILPHENRSMARKLGKSLRKFERVKMRHIVPKNKSINFFSIIINFSNLFLFFLLWI